MTNESLTTSILAVLDHERIADGGFAHARSGMFFLRHHTPTGQDATLYRPLVCVVLQGAKEVATGTRSLTIADGQSLLVSQAVPVTSRITQASRDRPYVALVLPLDLGILRSLLPNVPTDRSDGALDPFSLTLGEADDGLHAALARYLEQTETPLARQLLAPITLREIHARLLLGPHGASLRRLLWQDTTARRIFVATSHMQARLSARISVAELAQKAGMSTSAFFEHFKAVTGTTPLQYQKDLRLLQARDQLRSSREKVSRIAYSVGYDSPAQFSREYARKFGLSPKQDQRRGSQESAPGQVASGLA